MSASGPFWRSADDHAADIVRALNGRRCGNGWICRCPAHDDRHPSLAVTLRDGKVLIKCWGGCPQDVVIDTLRRQNLWGGKPSHASQARKTSDFAAESEPSRDPMKSWRNAAPLIRGSLADVYLRRRGIELTDDEARSVRFAPSLWHWPSRLCWPCMLARVALATGEDLATHQTFIELDGSGKAPVGNKARLFVAGARTVAAGVWFGRADPAREFVVGEGIESTLSGMRLSSVRAGCAALSAFGIRRLILPPQAKLVRIWCDNDELAQSVTAARAAADRWRAEGRTVAASMSPTVGMDPNDIWLGKLRRTC
jgi:putative DNA primase/helicase